MAGPRSQHDVEEMKAALPSNNESARLRTLQGCKVLDTPPDRTFDDIATLALRWPHKKRRDKFPVIV